MADPKEIEFMDVSPAQIVSVATAMIPFLEHNDANRALMGANMQRQAVPLMIPQAPLVGTGLEYRAAVDSGDVIVATNPGRGRRARRHADRRRGQGNARRVRPDQVHALEPGHAHPPQADRAGSATRSSPGSVLADGSSTDYGELALGANLLVAFMPFEGYNFEDAIVLSERLVKNEVLTSIHIHEYEIDARSTKLGDEEITRDIPNRSEESLRNLDDRGIVRIGAEVGSGDLLVGKVTPKGETELTAEEKLIRAIFKEKAREVRDTSLKVPHGEGGVVIDVKTFSRDNGDDLSPGVNELVRVYVAKKRKISEGDKLAGRHGNKGVISKIVPEEDMPFLEDGRSVDILLNPLGVPSRMNIGQILETHLGWAAAHGVFVGDGVEVMNGNASRVINAPAPTPVATPVFDGATRRGRRRGARSLGRRRTPTARSSSTSTSKQSAGRRVSGKVRLFNGRTGEPFEQKVTVGYMYILKLLHLVDDKIHARSTGPVLARHPAAARRQGAVRRAALRRDGGLGARGLRRRLHAPGDAHDQVRRHRRPRQGLRGDRQGREHRRAVDPRVVQGAAQGDAVAGARRPGDLRGRRRGRGARGGRRAAPRRGGARHRPLARLAARRPPAAESRARSSRRPPRRASRTRRSSRSRRPSLDELELSLPIADDEALGALGEADVVDVDVDD